MEENNSSQIESVHSTQCESNFQSLYELTVNGPKAVNCILYRTMRTKEGPRPFRHQAHCKAPEVQLVKLEWTNRGLTSGAITCDTRSTVHHSN